jgi:SagB-type dehydrogenase family enzyme
MMLKRTIIGIVIVLAALSAFLFRAPNGEAQSSDGGSRMSLPEPRVAGEMSLEECLAARRSVRSYGARALTLSEVSQVLWAAQGITDAHGHRTAPSAGALYPVKLYLAVGEVSGLSPGLYEYHPDGHALTLVKEGDPRRDLTQAALSQQCVGAAKACLVIAAVPSVTEAKYGGRAMRYIDNEAGCICQNIYLQCQALGLGTVCIGAFDDTWVAEVVGTDAEPRILMPFGPRP